MTLDLHEEAQRCSDEADQAYERGHSFDAGPLYQDAAVFELAAFRRTPLDQQQRRDALALNAVTLYTKAVQRWGGLAMGVATLAAVDTVLDALHPRSELRDDVAALRADILAAYTHTETRTLLEGP